MHPDYVIYRITRERNDVVMIEWWENFGALTGDDLPRRLGMLNADPHYPQNMTFHALPQAQFENTIKLLLDTYGVQSKEF